MFQYNCFLLQFYVFWSPPSLPHPTFKSHPSSPGHSRCGTGGCDRDLLWTETEGAGWRPGAEEAGLQATARGPGRRRHEGEGWPRSTVPAGALLDEEVGAPRNLEV